MGRQLHQLAPAALLTQLERTAREHGGSLTQVPTRTTALSRTCLCGAQVAKPLAQRRHACTCPDLAGQVLHRDLFSAFLATAAIPADRGHRGAIPPLSPAHRTTMPGARPDTSLARFLWTGYPGAGQCLQAAVSAGSTTWTNPHATPAAATAAAVGQVAAELTESTDPADDVATGHQGGRPGPREGRKPQEQKPPPPRQPINEATNPLSNRRRWRAIRKVGLSLR